MITQYGAEVILSPAGVPQAFTAISIFNLDGSLASLYTDISGSTPGANPVTTDSSGNLVCFLAVGRYNQSVAGGPLEPLIADIPGSAVGIAGGVAGLDGGGKVPVAQLPGVAIDSTVVHKAGDTMTGALAMGSHAITGLAPGVNPTDAATVSQLGGPGGASPTGAAGGDLSGSVYPNPVLAPGVVTDVKVASANKDGIAGTPSMRTLGAGALQAAAGNLVPLTGAAADNAVVHSAGDTMTGALVMSNNKITSLLPGTNPTDAATVSQINSGIAGTPTGPAGGDLAGNYPNPTILYKDGPTTTPSMRTLGQGALQAAPGNLVPSGGAAADNAVVHNFGDTMVGPLAMSSHKITGLAPGTNAADAVSLVQIPTDGVAATASIRTLGQGAQQAAPGNLVPVSGAAADNAVVHKAGDAMTGALAMGSNKITGITPGTASNDAATVSQVGPNIHCRVYRTGAWSTTTGPTIFNFDHNTYDMTPLTYITNQFVATVNAFYSMNGYLACFATAGGQYIQTSIWHNGVVATKGSTGISQAAGNIIDSVVAGTFKLNAGDTLWLVINSNPAGMVGVAAQESCFACVDSLGGF